MIKRIVAILIALMVSAVGFSASAGATERDEGVKTITDSHCSPDNYWMLDSAGSLYRGEDTKPFKINRKTVNVHYKDWYNTDIAASKDTVYIVYGYSDSTSVEAEQIIRTLDLQTGDFAEVKFKLPKTDALGNEINYPEGVISPNALSLFPDGSLIFGIWNMGYIFSLQKDAVDKAKTSGEVLQAKAITVNIDKNMKDNSIVGSSGDFAPDPYNPDGMYFLVAQNHRGGNYSARLVYLTKDEKGIYSNLKILGKLTKEDGSLLTNVWGMTVSNQKIIISDDDGRGYRFKDQPKATDNKDTNYMLEEVANYNYPLYGAGSSQEYVTCHKTNINFVDSKGRDIGNPIQVLAPVSTQPIDYELPKCNVYSGCNWKPVKTLITRDGKSHTIVLETLSKPVKIENNKVAPVETKMSSAKYALANTGTYVDNIILVAVSFIVFGSGLMVYRYRNVCMK